MNKLFKNLNWLLAIVLALTLYSCETTDLDLKTNPNALPLPAADASLLLNGVQVSFANMTQNFGTTAAEVTRLKYMSGRNYNNAYSPSDFDNNWRLAYRNVVKNIRVMNPIAEGKGFKKHLGMGQVMEAFTMITMVDFFGNVPYTEAFNETNLNPKLDAGADVYKAALILLDQAIANFAAPSTVLTEPTNDFYYNKDWAKWTKLANTIKLKIYIQTKLVDPTAIAKFNAIVASNQYIGVGEDFKFQWGTSNSNPDSRHPEYVRNYSPTGVDTGYQANWLLDEMRNKKSVVDPRIRYYFYRQLSVVNPTNNINLNCTIVPIPAHLSSVGSTYCIINNDNGYWGRDHGNDENIPNDRGLRTAAGLYPAGGRFDGNNFAGITSITLGTAGAGITPIILASTVDFWRAEAALSPGGTGDAKALTLSGAAKSINYVKSFIGRDASANITFVPAATVTTTYLNDVGVKYDAAVAGQKLNVVMTEFFISLYGQGIDAFNAYRRTGFPKTLQPNLEANPGGFMRSFYYPASESGANINVPQKANVLTQVFWDNNPATGFLTSN